MAKLLFSHQSDPLETQYMFNEINNCCELPNIPYQTETNMGLFTNDVIVLKRRAGAWSGSSGQQTNATLNVLINSCERAETREVGPGGGLPC